MQNADWQNTLRTFLQQQEGKTGNCCSSKESYIFPGLHSITVSVLISLGFFVLAFSAKQQLPASITPSVKF